LQPSFLAKVLIARFSYTLTRFDREAEVSKSGLELKAVGLKSKYEDTRDWIRLGCPLLVSCSRPRFL
jgi:hypothetical protein